MDLWIRSQNKGTLLKVYILGNTDGVITNYFENGNCVLGTYKSSKRALEVLDEIQKLLNPKSMLKFNCLLGKNDIEKIKQATENKYVICDNNQDIKLPNSIVYEMPEE